MQSRKWRFCKARFVMKEIRFKCSKLSLVMFCLMFILLIIAILFTLCTSQKYDSRGTMLIPLSMYVMGGLFLIWGVIKVSSLRFTEEGIRQRVLSGWRFIAWKEITCIKFDKSGRLYLYKNGQKIIVPNLLVCENPEEIVAFVHQHLSPQQMIELSWQAQSSDIRNGL